MGAHFQLREQAEKHSLSCYGGDIAFSGLHVSGHPSTCALFLLNLRACKLQVRSTFHEKALPLYYTRAFGKTSSQYGLPRLADSGKLTPQSSKGNIAMFKHQRATRHGRMLNKS
eukprot:3955085-Amphidinium_carterae.1